MAFNKPVLLVAVIVIVLCVLAKVVSKAKTQENFSTDPDPPEVELNTDYVKAVYKRKGVETCDLLSSSDYMSKNFVDPLRFRKWKPAESDPLYKEYMESRKQNGYCYFFMDDDKRILHTNDNAGYAPVTDPIASLSNCSKENNIFKSPLITDVFQSTGYDVTHNLPYKKCVLKIDKELATQSNVVTSFWRNFTSDNNAFCDGMVKTLQGEMDAYQDTINDLTNKLSPFRATYTSTTNAKELVGACKTKNQELDESIQRNKEDLEALAKEVEGTNLKYSGIISDLRASLQKLLQKKDADTSRYEATYNDYNFNLNANLKALLNTVEEASTKNSACAKTLYTLETELNDLKAKYDTTDMQRRALQSEYEKCAAALMALNEEIVVLTEEYKKKEQALADVRKRLKQCEIDQDYLLKEEAFWRDKFKKLSDAYKVCARERAIVDERIRYLKQRVDALLLEIEEIKKRCRDDKSAFNQTTVEMHREAAKEINATEHQKCAASIAMRQRKVELLNEINGILSQVTGCDRLITSCKCYRKVGEFGWNDDGVLGTRAYTSTGRIDEVRKYVDNAPYIQFIYNNGTKSPLYKIVNTKRDEGGPSYIDTDKIPAVNGANMAAMFVQE